MTATARFLPEHMVKELEQVHALEEIIETYEWQNQCLAGRRGISKAALECRQETARQARMALQRIKVDPRGHEFFKETV